MKHEDITYANNDNINEFDHEPITDFFFGNYLEDRDGYISKGITSTLNLYIERESSHIPIAETLFTSSYVCLNPETFYT